jgi:hypothetical protein
MYKDFNTRLTKLQERAELSNPRYMLKKLLQDSDNLEKFYTDKEYRNKLESAATYPSFEYAQLEDILEQDKKVKEKLNLPENSTIRLETVKGSNRSYWHAYFWIPQLKKLKKRYIGKSLPIL